MLNPANNQFAERLKNLQAQQSSLSTTTQPSFIDWLPLNPGEFTYASATSFTTAFTPSQVFEVGDRLYINLGAGRQYFFITRVIDGTNTVEFDGGKNYTYSNTAITEIGTSRLPNPSGFPSNQDFVKDATAEYRFATVNTYTNRDVFFWMQGSIVTATYDVRHSFSTSGSDIRAYVTLPLAGYSGTSSAELILQLGYLIGTLDNVWGTGSSSYDTVALIDIVDVDATSFLWPNYCRFSAMPINVAESVLSYRDIVLQGSISYDIRGKI